MANLPVGAVESSGGSRTAVSWPAIFGGAVVGAAVGLLLLTLGVGFGLLSVSPWGGASPTAFGVGAAIWLVVIEWISAAVGGYIAGRLRTKWVAVHTHEVFFRDTAHGFITWALSTVVVFALFASTLTAVISGATGAATSVASGAAQGATSALPDLLSGGSGYFTDLLFRATPATSTAAPAATAPAAAVATPPAPAAASASEARSEATTVLLHSVATGKLADDDRTYLGQLIAEQTGLTTADAETRVDAVMKQVQDATTSAKNATDAARKAAAAASLIFALSLLIGAFVASVAAAIGGNERDEAEQLVEVIVR